MRTLLIASAVAAIAVVAAGCGGGSSGGPGEPPGNTSIPRATGATDVLVNVRSGIGAYTPPEYAIDDRPVFRLYGDGTVVIRGDEDGALPQPATYHLSEEGIDAVLEAADEAGLLGEAPEYGEPSITDVGSTSVAVTTGGETQVHDAYALGYEEETLDSLTSAEREARNELKGFIDFVTGLPEAQAELLLDHPAPLALEAVEVHAWPAPDDVEAEAIDWPAATPLPGKETTDSLAEGCLTLRGEDLDAVVAALGDAQHPTYWQSGGKVWSAGYRAVLPGETACEEAEPVGYKLPPSAVTPLEPVPGGVLVETTDDDVVAAEEALSGHFATTADPREGEVADQLASYTRQYVGIDLDGRVLVYVNAFCNDTGRDPATEYVDVLDGGSCFWQAVVDPSSGEIVSLTINGVA